MYDVIVVGGGIIGLWTSYHLAKSNKKVILVEQFKFNHSNGSSHGFSRLMKHSHRKSQCSDLFPESYQLWQELQKYSAETILFQTGHLSVVEKNSTQHLFDDLMLSLRNKSISFEYLPGNKVVNKFPSLDFDSTFESYFEDNGAVLRANLCRNILLQQIEKLGVQVLENTKVDKIETTLNKVNVKTQDGKVFLASSLVLCCGSWINKVLGNMNSPIELELEPVKVVTYYWKEKIPTTYSRHKGFPPMMIYKKKYHVYSIPSDDIPGYLKICYHYRHKVDPDLLPTQKNDEIEKNEQKRKAELKTVVKEHFPMVDTLHEPIAEPAFQTVTKNSNFILTRHPNFSNVIIGAGFSGHGFGASPSVGRILKDLVLKDLDVESFCCKNFPIQVKQSKAKI